MAALALPPYRSPPSSVPSTGPSSSSSTVSSTPSKKPETNKAVAAGRRRLEEFKRKKASDKVKKSSTVSPSDEPAQFFGEGEQSSALPVSNDSKVSSKAESNGYISNDSRSNGMDLVPARVPSLAGSSIVMDTHREEAVSKPPVLQVHGSFPGMVERDTERKGMASVWTNHDSNVARPSHTQVLELPATGFSGQSMGKGERGLGSSTALDSTNIGRVGIPTLGATGPLVVPKPAPVSLGVSGHFSSATGSVKLEPTKKAATHPSLSIRTSSSSGSQSSINSSTEKGNGGSLVMLDSKLVSSNAHEQNLLRSTAKPEQELSVSGKHSLSSGSIHSISKNKVDKQTDGISSTSGLSGSSQGRKANAVNAKREYETGSAYPDANSFRSSLPASLGINTSFTVSGNSTLLYPPLPESAAPRFLQIPLSRPPLTNSATKSELFLPSALSNASGSGSSSSNLSTTLSSTPSLFENTLNQPFTLPNVKSPALESASEAPRENGKAKRTMDSLGTLSPTTSMSVVEVPIQSSKVPETADKSSHLWPVSSGRDDFSMLEQHIEDLTQEKFSLQRGLDAARVLAESLAEENSALTQDYNNQGATVNDLKAETEKLHAEIRAQAVVVKNMKAERDKAVQESSAAIERSQALAAEVIALEEKVLRARSQELKVGREMESLTTENESQKRLLMSLDKDRANMKTLVEALQEEKGLLQAQIRKAVAGSSGESGRASTTLSTVGSSGCRKADVGTSTDDLGGWGVADHMRSQPLEQHGHPLIVSSLPSRPLSSPSHASQASSSFSSLPTLGSFSGQGLSYSVSSVIPPDHAATIENIHNLITELTEEKEAVLKALRAESVAASELRKLNAELSHKLEVQTQRLELAVAQSMAHGSTPRVETNYAVSRLGPEYVDEGDEVVDRVLGWIMQLFPSGSSRRKRL